MHGSMLDINYPSQVLQLLHMIKGRNSFIFKVSIKLVYFFSRLWCRVLVYPLLALGNVNYPYASTGMHFFILNVHGMRKFLSGQIDGNKF